MIYDKKEQKFPKKKKKIGKTSPSAEQMNKEGINLTDKYLFGIRGGELYHICYNNGGQLVESHT